MRILDVIRDPTTSPEFSTAPELRRDHLGPILRARPCCSPADRAPRASRSARHALSSDRLTTDAPWPARARHLDLPEQAGYCMGI